VALTGWLLDKSAAARAGESAVREQLHAVAGFLYLCPMGELEQLYSARSAHDYDELSADLHESFELVAPPADIFDRALGLQRDLAHHHGMWHRTPIPDLFIAETALHHGLGVVHVDRGYERIAEVRPLRVRRLR
jgi:predicted nucleic acid-binding protein